MRVPTNRIFFIVDYQPAIFLKKKQSDFASNLWIFQALQCFLYSVKSHHRKNALHSKWEILLGWTNNILSKNAMYTYEGKIIWLKIVFCDYDIEPTPPQVNNIPRTHRHTKTRALIPLCNEEHILSDYLRTCTYEV